MNLPSIIFDKPERLVISNSWISHIPFAFFIMDYLKPNIFVELGVHTGNSYFAFCQAVQKIESNTKCYGIDHWEGDEHLGYHNGKFFNDVNNYNIKYENFSTLIRSDFNEAVHQFQDNSIDLLHIDGHHSYDSVKNDFVTWIQKMSKKGIILFHDIIVKKEDFGVYKFWEELKNTYKYIEFNFQYGLGVLFLDYDFHKLFIDDYSQNFETYQNIFKSLGENILYIDEINELNNKSDQLRKEINNQSAKKNIFLENEIVKYKNLVRNSNLELKKIRSEFDKIKSEISRARNTKSWKLMEFFHLLYNESIFNTFNFLINSIFKSKSKKYYLSKYDPIKSSNLNSKNIDRSKISVYVSTKGNFVFNEIAEVVAGGFSELGYNVNIKNQYDGIDDSAFYNIIIAFNEMYFVDDYGKKFLNQIPDNSILIHTEQINFSDYNLNSSFLSKFKEIWDIDFSNFNLLNELGFNVKYMKIGFTEKSNNYKEYKKIPKSKFINLNDNILSNSYLNADFIERPIDILFYGSSTNRRDAFFDKNNNLFKKYNSFIHLNKRIVQGPISNPENIAIDTATAIGLSQRTKILLNIHRSETKFFEWHRIVMHGIWNRCLVISETTTGSGFFVPGKHYIECDLDDMPEIILYYLNTSQGKFQAQEIIDNGYDHLTVNCKLKDNLKILMENF